MMTPETIASAGTERAHQMALFAWAALNVGTYPELEWMFAIKNAEKGGAIRGSMAKAEGVKAGVLDIMLPVARKGFHGLFIEMKKEGGKPSKEQCKFGKFIHVEDYHSALCYNWEEAKAVIETYLKKN